MTSKGNFLLPLLALPLLGGCITTIDSRKATDAAEGQRYALPLPVLKVEPLADGTIAVEVLYLPDPNNTYTIKTTSFLANYTLDVKTKEGLLDTVSFSPNSSAVAEQMATSASNIEKARIDARSKADEAEAKAAEGEAKALADAASVVVTARAKRDKLVELKASGGKVTDEQIAAAEVELASAEAKLENLKGSGYSLNEALNQPGADTFLTAAGPIFFAMVPGDNGTVDLVASGPQVVGQTSFAIARTEKPKTVVYEIDGSGVLRLGGDALELRLKASPAPKSVLEDDIELKSHDGAILADLKPTVNLTTSDGQQIVVVTFADNTPAGKYRLIIPVVGPDDTMQQPADVLVEIRKKSGK